MLGVKYCDRISRWQKGLEAPNMTNLLKFSCLYQVPVHELYEGYMQKINLKILKERKKYIRLEDHLVF
jgi:hypothetical protein